jgi:hypothetical protein
MPNARQTATLIWLGVVLIFMLCRRDLRASLAGIVRTALGGKVATPILVMAIWIAGEVFIGRKLSWWDTTMVTSTVFWSVGTGILLLMNAATEPGREGFFRRNLLGTVRVAAFLSVFMNLAVLRLPFEIALQPFIFLLVGVSAVTGPKKEEQQVKKLMNGLLGITLVGLAAYEIDALVRASGGPGHENLAWQFFLPVWLAIGLLPFLYCITLWSGYELAFVRTELSSERKWGRRIALVASFGLRTHQLEKFISASAWSLNDAASFGESRRLIREARLHPPEDEDDDYEETDEDW